MAKAFCVETYDEIITSVKLDAYFLSNASVYVMRLAGSINE